MIRRAKIEELNSLMLLLRAVIANLNSLGIDQWDEIYPDAVTINNDIQERTLFVLEEDGVIKGMVVLNEFQDKEYIDVEWRHAAGKALVVHRLSVHPSYQGQGVARRLMHFTERFADDNGYTSIRLDTFSKNPITMSFYKSLRYGIAGTVNFRKGLFYCFEKAIRE